MTKKIINEMQEQRNDNVNVSASFEPGRTHVTQNIRQITYNNPELDIMSILRPLYSQGSNTELITQFRENYQSVHDRVSEETLQKMFAVADAYYNTMYALSAEAAEELNQEAAKIVNEITDASNRS